MTDQVDADHGDDAAQDRDSRDVVTKQVVDQRDGEQGAGRHQCQRDRQGGLIEGDLAEPDPEPRAHRGGG